MLLLDGPRAGRPQQISPASEQLVELACLEPVAEGLPITHSSSADLARQIVTDGIVAAIHPAMARRTLQQVDL